jgi:hypothetical protein
MFTMLLITLICPFNLYAQIYEPSDYTSLGSLVVDTGTVAIDTSAGTIVANGQTYTGVLDTQTAEIDGETFNANVAIFCFDTVSISSTATISVSGGRALYMLSKQDIVINSNLNIKQAGRSNKGRGISTDHEAGTGGGYGNRGGDIWSSNVGLVEVGGRQYGEPTLSLVLLGGSNGGYGHVGGCGNGAGAFALVASNELTINATLKANGTNSEWAAYPGGGGSGGGILLKAPTITFGETGLVEALGGTGPAGPCGAGCVGSSGRVAMYYNLLQGYDVGDVDIHSLGCNPSVQTTEGTLYMETPNLILQSPNGDDKVLVGNTYPIQWTSGTAMGISDVRLEYSIDNGQNWIEIAIVENSGIYDWQVPDVESDQCLVRVEDTQGSYTTDTSDATFMIFTCNEILPGDITGDCYVNIEDLAVITSTWLACGNPFDASCSP